MRMRSVFLSTQGAPGRWNNGVVKQWAMQFSSRIIGNMVGIWVSTLMLAGIWFEKSESGWNTLLDLFLIALILTLVNSLVRPLVKVLAFPLYILTLGLFTLITNGLVFSLAAWLATQVHLPLFVDGWWSAVWAGTITAIVGAIVSSILGALIPKNSN